MSSPSQRRAALVRAFRDVTERRTERVRYPALPEVPALESWADRKKRHRLTDLILRGSPRSPGRCAPSKPAFPQPLGEQ